MRYFLMLAFLLWGGHATLYAQHVLYGKITGNNNEVLGGSHIHIAENFASADPDGNYSVSVPRGWNRLYVSFLGYKQVDTLIQVTSDTELNLMLKQEVSALAEVVITDQTNVPVVARELTRKTVEQFSSASIGDLLREIPGVSSLRSGTAVVKPIIHGLHSSRVVIVNNNVRMEDHQWGAEHAPSIDVNSAGSVSLVKGAEALRYGGDAIGGIVIIEPQNIPLRDTLYGQTILNGATNGRGGSISSSITKGTKSGWQYRALGTYKHFGDREAPDYVLSNTGNRELNAMATIGFRGDGFGFSADYSFYSANIGILRASHIGNISDLVSAINNESPSVVNPFSYEIDAPRQQVAHHLAKLAYYRQMPIGKLSFQYAFQYNNRQEFDIRRTESGKPSLDLDLSTHSVNADMDSKFGRTSVTYGISAQYQNNTPNPQTGVRRLIPDYNKYDVGAYATVKKQVDDKIRLEAGARYDFSRIDAIKYYLKSRWETNGYNADFNEIITGDFGTQWRTNPIFNYHNLSASTGLKYSVSDATQWITNASIASRNPNPSELFSDGLHHASGQIELGDLRLEKEVVYKISTLANFEKDTWQIQVNPFFSYIDDFIIDAPTGIEQSIRGAFPVWEYMQAPVRMFGIDAGVVYTAQNFGYKSDLSYVNGTNLETDMPLISMPPLQWKNSVTYRNENWHQFSAGIRSEAAFFQSRYPDNDFIADVSIDGQPVPTNVNISRPPAGYHLLHFNSSMEFGGFANSTVHVAFNIHNVMNTNYRDYLNRNRYYADDIGRNFTLQIKINY